MLRLLQDMRQELSGRAGRGGGGRGNQGGRGGRGAGNRTRNRRTPDNTNFARSITDKYCHTHGGCNHNSADCTRKALGHEDAATMENRLGGLNAFCGE